MKKLLISVLAISGLMACTKSDVVEMPQSQAIKFGSAFVDNSTKVVDNSCSANTDVTSFKVWGNLIPTGGTTYSKIFTGQRVTQTSSGVWQYDDQYIQYWIPTVQYKFAAIAGLENETSSGTPATVTYTNCYESISESDGIPTSINAFNVQNQTDLMYATAEASKAADGTYTGASDGTVSFTFNHLLSKVQFEFVNAYPEASNLYIKVTDIKIVNPYLTGTYTINPGTWGSQTLGTNYNLDFGDAGEETVDPNGTVTEVANYIAPNNGSAKSNYARLMIPGTYANKLYISFVATVYLKQGTDTYTEITALKIDKSSDYVVPTNLSLNNNHSYNFKITLSSELTPIKFSVGSITGWTPGEGITDSDSNTDTEIPLL